MIKKLVPSVRGLEIQSENIDSSDKNHCETCISTKMTKKPFKSSERRATKPLELVHSDIAGPMRTPTANGGELYVINFVDDFSRHTKVYLMKRKSQALEKFKEYIADVGRPNIICVKSLRSDNGGEYKSEEFNKFCREYGIKRELTIPNTPEQNGVAERNWRTLFEMTRGMLKTANLDNKWWGRAIITAAYVKNRCLTSTNQENKTPHELFTGKVPDVSNLRIFGCNVYSYNDEQGKSKLDDRAIPGLFMGYGERSKGYVVYLQSIDKLVLSRNIEFLEGEVKSNKINTDSHDLSRIGGNFDEGRVREDKEVVIDGENRQSSVEQPVVNAQ
jgi:hypothetical protein